MTLASAARDVVTALTDLQQLVGDSTELREVSLRLFAKMADEEIARPLAEKIIASGEEDRNRRQKLEEEKIRSEIERNRKPQSTPPAHRAKPRSKAHEGNSHAARQSSITHYEPDV